MPQLSRVGLGITTTALLSIIVGGNVPGVILPLAATIPVTGLMPLSFSGLNIPGGNLVTVTVPAGADYDVRYK